MKNLKRCLTLCLFIAAPLGCLAVIGWKYQADYAQQKRDQALIAAVKADRPSAVLAALRQGANPNARDIPPDPRTLWQKALAFLRPVKTEGAAPFSALRLAVDHNWEGAPLPPPSVSFTILKALHESGAADEGDAPPFRAQFEEQEQIVKERMNTRPVTPDDLNMNGPASTLTGYLCRYGMSAQGYAAVARCEMKQGYYAAAVSNLKIAQIWLPNDAGIAAERAQAEAWDRTRRRIEAQISGARRVISVTPFPDKQGQILWAALSCGQANSGENDAARITIYRTQNGACRRVFNSGILKAPGADVSDSREANLSVLYMTGRRSPEIVVQTASQQTSNVQISANQMPYSTIVSSSGCLYIYEWRGVRLKRLFGRRSDPACKIVDLRADGQAEIWEASHPTDSDLPPLDFSVYAFRGGKFAPVCADFAFLSKKYVARAEMQRGYVSPDMSTLHNLAYYYSLIGDQRKADWYYRRAEAHYREEIAEADEKEVVSDKRADLKQIQARDADER